MLVIEVVVVAVVDYVGGRGCGGCVGCGGRLCWWSHPSLYFDPFRHPFTLTRAITAFVQMVVLFLSHQLNEFVWSARSTHVERFFDVQTNHICV